MPLTETPAPTYADLVAQIEAEKAAQPTFTKGMRVRSTSNRYPGLGTVTKVNPVNVKVQMDSGITVNFGKSYLRPAGDESAPAPVVTVTEVPLPDFNAYPAGTVVRFIDPRAITRFGAGLFVVIKNGGDRINVAKIGGDNDRYVRAAAQGLVRVPLSEVAQHLA